MDDIQLIERYFRKELTPDESSRFRDRLATDPDFKVKFETESLVHKAIQFSRSREKVKSFAANPALSARPAAEWLDNKGLIMIAGTALVVWIVSTFSSSATNLSPEKIKWVGVIVSIAAALLLMVLARKTMNFRGVISGVFNGLLIFVVASGIDAINQGARGITDEPASEANLIPFTENKPWWPTQSLEDSLELNRKKILELGNQVKTLVASRLGSGPNFGLGLFPGKFTPVVAARSSTAVSGANYEADMFLATWPLTQTIEMRVDGKPIAVESDPSGVKKGKVSFKASADRFDNTGTARKKFVAEIVVGDSTYRREVEYSVLKPK
jgi:hypothetical protein